MKRALKYVAFVPIALVVAVIIWKANLFLLPFATIEENGQTVSG